MQNWTAGKGGGVGKWDGDETVEANVAEIKVETKITKVFKARLPDHCRHTL